MLSKTPLKSRKQINSNSDSRIIELETSGFSISQKQISKIVDFKDIKGRTTKMDQEKERMVKVMNLFPPRETKLGELNVRTSLCTLVEDPNSALYA